MNESQGNQILSFLDSCPGLYTKNREKTLRFIEAILWVVRRGAQWDALPEKYGKWKSVHKRFSRWCARGIFEQMHRHFVTDPELEYLLVDSTIIRAHPCAAGGERTNRTASVEAKAAPALGRSCGGCSTKIHMLVDALGNPLDFILTAGQVHDVTQAQTLLQGRHTEYVVADKGYDSTPLLEFIAQMGAIPGIPARKNRTAPRDYDTHIYKERHLIECFINKIKWYRRIFARFDKLDRHFFGFLSFVATLIWLR